MEDQTDRILKEKILSAVESPLPELTRRAVELPASSNKALAVIGMRRAGKTSFLHQCRGDLMAQGRNPKNLVYFNFEDERLGGGAGSGFAQGGGCACAAFSAVYARKSGVLF